MTPKKSHKNILLIGVITVLVFYIISLAYNEQQSRQQLKYAELAQKKAEQDRQFSAEQTRLCFDVYTKESSKFNNVSSWRYDAYKDECVLIYRETLPKSKEQCAKMFAVSESLDQYAHCLDGTFENVF